MQERRKNVLDGVLEDLDDTCQFILAEVIKHPEGIGFNALLREMKHLRDVNYNRMARTTLSEHLQHLQLKHLIEKPPPENSNLNLKPSKYRTSQYFRDLSKELMAESITPEDYLPLMMKEDAQTVTRHLMSIITGQLADCLVGVIQSPENISIYNMHQAFYNLETLMRAYRQRIQQQKEESLALETIRAWSSERVDGNNRWPEQSR